MCDGDAGQHLAQMLISLEIDRRPSFLHSSKTGKGIHALSLVFKLCVCGAGEGGMAERGYVLDGITGCCSLSCPTGKYTALHESWILILTPLVSGCVTLASLPSPLSLGWYM